MANTYNSGSVYVDTDGHVVTKPCRVAYILFTPDAANDAAVVYDGSSTSAPLKMKLQGATAKQTMYFSFAEKPLSFSTGVYVDIPTSGTMTLILTSEGATS